MVDAQPPFAQLEKFMENSRRFTRNIFSSWLGFFVQIAVLVVLTPVVLKALGPERYGVWALLATITGYFGLMDAGARASITHHIVRHRAAGDFDRMNRMASAALAAVLGCGAVVLLATLLCAGVGAGVFRVPAEHASEFRWSVLAIGGSVALQFCFFVHSAALGARQRHDLGNATQIFASVLYACCVPVILAAGGGLVSLAAWLSATNLLAYMLRWPIARRVVPELSISLRSVRWNDIKEFSHFGLGQFLVNLSHQIIGCSDAIVISITMSTTAVAPFYLANRVARCFVRFFMPVSVVLFPMLTHLHAVGDAAKVRRIYLRGTRLMWILSLGLAIVAVCWASDFFALWVGQQLAESSEHVSYLFYILIAGAAVTAPQQMALPVFLALERQRFIAALFVAEAVANVGLSLALVGKYGLSGIALGTLLPALLFQGIVHPLVTCRTLGIHWSAYVKELVRPLAFAAMLATLAMLRPNSLLNGWLSLVFAGVCTSVVALAVALILGCDRADRERFLFTPARRLLCGIGILPVKKPVG